MNTKEVLDKYKEAYFKYHECYPEIIQKGSWYYVGSNPTALRIKNLKEMAEELIKRRQKERPVHVAPAASGKEIIETLKIPKKIQNHANKILKDMDMLRGDYITNIPHEADDMKKLLTNIHKCGTSIFHSTNIKECQRLGKEIAKNAKSILNTLE